MSRLYLLDTNMVSYAFKGKSPAARLHLTSLGFDEVASISVITEAELLYGMAKSKGGERSRKSLEWFLMRLKVHPWERETAAVYASLRVRQESMGKSLGALDMQIAAHAVALGAILVTNDQAFQHVPDLVGLENWATDL